MPADVFHRHRSFAILFRARPTRGRSSADCKRVIDRIKSAALMRRCVLLCGAKFLEVALPIEVSQCAAVHQFEVGKSLCAADALLDKKAEVLVKLCRRDVREVEGTGRKAGLEGLLEGDAFGGNLLG